MAGLSLNGANRLPLYLQAETAECGLACVGMVSAWHGWREDLTSLRQRFGPGGRGSTLNHLIQLCADLRLTTRAIRCEVAELRSLALPAILHWDFNHFVVLRSTSWRGVVVHDPAVGKRHYSWHEVSRHFTGIALETARGDGFESGDVKRTNRLADYFKGLGSLVPCLGQILLLSALLQVVALASPFYMQLVVDEVLVKHDTDLLVLLAAGFLALTLFSVVTQAVRGWAGIYLSNQLSFFMGARLFTHLLRLPATFFAHRQMGDVVSRFGSLKPIQEFLTSSTIAVLLDGVMAVTTITMMYLYSPPLASVVLVTTLLHLLIQLIFYSPIRLRSHEKIAAEARAESNFMESIRSIDAVKRFGIEAQRSGDWQNRFSDAVNAEVRVSRLGLGLDLFQSTIAGASNVLVIYLGARFVLAGELTIGMLYAFMAYRSHMTGAVNSLVDEFVKFLMLSLHLERLADIQQEAPEPTTVANPPTSIAGELNCRDLGFRYSNRDPWIFNDISFHLQPGESLAVAGPSGCGKSTLLGVIAQTLSAAEGEIAVDGYPLACDQRATFRAVCASVMQGDTLLSGSIRSNIAFGDAGVDDARVQRAAETACVHADVMHLPMGYESLVGEMGSTLSAGQLQRVLIARALYREPRILLLDEGTAHLDKETELRVMKNILELGITCIFITHNRKMLALADRVLFMSAGSHRLRRVRHAEAA